MKLKLAIMADIHGNIHALEAVLRDIESLQLDQVIVNGDMVNRAPNNIRVLERLRELSYSCTLGNHEDLVRKWFERDPDIPTDWYGDSFWKGIEWPVQELAEAGWLDWFRELPMTYRIEEPGAPTLLISHGSPRHYREGYGHFLKDEKFTELADSYSADILIGSHTHRPYERRIGQQTFINTGAVGAPFNQDPRAQYLLMTLSDGRWKWEYRAVPYDREAALASYEQTGYIPEGNLSAFIFREELRYAIPIYSPFWSWTQKEQKTKDWSAWQEFRDVYARILVLPNEQNFKFKQTRQDVFDPLKTILLRQKGKK
jgi:predicted phosphodiesterase